MKCPDVVNFMRRNNFTQQKLAEKLGCTTSFIGTLATSRSSISYKMLLDLIDLDMTPEELFGEVAGAKLRKQCEADYSNKLKLSGKTDPDNSVDIVISGLAGILEKLRK